MLGPLVGGLLSSKLRDVPSTVAVPNGFKKIVKNLEHCDVKSEGTCCYFPNYCDPIARCISDPSPSNLFELIGTLPRCQCPSGFEGDGRVRGTGCENINECELGTSRCEQHCLDLIPGYQCQCHPGFRLNRDGRTCSDIDECGEAISGCEQLCMNEPGTFTCDCREGYALAADGKHCDDIDECAEASLTGYSVCQFDDLCLNLKGTYQCGCPDGLRQKVDDTRQCEDIDECSEVLDPCPNSIVKITPGVTSASQYCENLYGGFRCECLPGTKLRQLSNPNHTSSYDHMDRALHVSYIASEVEEIQRTSKLIARQTFCDDLDECTLEPEVCGTSNSSSVICVNLWRSFECICAQEGSVWHQIDLTCKDIDECIDSDHICGSDVHMRCRNQVPGYSCECEEGYERSEMNCLDIDECTAKIASCPAHAQCINKEGTYACICPPGFLSITEAETGRVLECEDIDECAAHLCSGPCLNLPGTYICGCSVGYHAPRARDLEITMDFSLYSDNVTALKEMFKNNVENVVKCEDLDECLLTQGAVCGEGCNCANREGDFSCSCPKKHKMLVFMLNEDLPRSLRLAQSLGKQIRSFPMEAIFPHMPHVNVLKALLTLNATQREPWMLTQIDWDKSSRFHMENFTIPLELYTSEAALLEFCGSILYQSSMQMCSKVDPCLDHTVCSHTSTPCCRTLSHGQFECVPSTVRLGSHRCPLNTIQHHSS